MRDEPGSGTPTAARQRGERMFALDVLRGLAIVLVLVRHIPAKPGDDEVVLGALFRAGWTGVDLFFVLSGFLISGLLFQEADLGGGIDFKRFWLRRGMKIWPAYYVTYGALSLSLIAYAVWRHTDVRLLEQIPNLIFIQNYFPHAVRWPHSWSLAIEEHFYIFLPLLVGTLASRGKLRLLPVIIVVACVGETLLRGYLATSPGRGWDAFYYPTHLRADSLFFGVGIGYVHRYHPKTLLAVARAWPLWILLALGGLVFSALIPLADGNPGTYTWGFTLLYVAFGGAIVVAAAHPGAGAHNALARAVAWLGVYSYTIYLAHSVVFRLPGVSHIPGVVREYLVDTPWVDRLMFWALSIVVGYVASHAVERPFLALRSKWLPSSRGELVLPIARSSASTSTATADSR